MFMHCGRKKHEGKRGHVAKHLKLGGVGGPYLKFELQLKSNKIFIGFSDSRIPRSPDSPIPGFPDSPIPGFPDSRIPRFPDSPIPRFPDSPFPVLKIALWLSFLHKIRIWNYYLRLKYCVEFSRCQLTKWRVIIKA
jgi:hypothetical protein